MYCPKCRCEYVHGIKECSDCKVALIKEIPAEGKFVPEYIDLVTVYSTGNLALIAVAKSILEDAGIKYFAKGENLQGLFGLGSFGVGFNPLMGPVQVQVGQQDEEIARELLKDLRP